MSEISLKPETIATLKRLSSINQSIRVVKGEDQIRVKSENNTIAVFAKLQESLPRDFNVYDIREFISVLNLIDKPVIDFSNDKFVLIKSADGKQQIKYRDADANVISSHFDKKFELSSLDAEIKLTAAQLKNVTGAASAMSLEYISFKAENGVLKVQAFNRNNGDNGETNVFSVELGDSTDTFDLIYKAERLAILDGDTTFSFSKDKVTKIENGNFEIWMALDTESTFA